MLAAVYLMNVVYADLIYSNISLDDSIYTKLVDFSGSLLDGSDLFVMMTASHKYPGDDKYGLHPQHRCDVQILSSSSYNSNISF